VAHILIASSEMAGRINISLALARRLVERGHTVTLANPVAAEGRAAAVGAGFVRLERGSSPAPEPGAPAASTAARLTARAGQLSTIRERRAAAARALNPDGWRATVRDLGPDLALVDIELPAETLATWATGVPVALWTSMLSVWKRPDVPPLHTGIIPGEGWRGSRLGIEGAWMRFRIGKWVGNQRRRLAKVGADRMSVLRTIADRYRFPFSAEISRYDWLLPYTYRTLPVLSFNALELEFPHQPRPNCSYVGPLLDRTRPGPASGGMNEQRQIAALATRRRRGRSEALIYCGFGAWHKGDDAVFLRRVVAAAGSHPEWDVVVGLGDRLATNALGETPSNVHVFSWVPQLDVLATADLAVHHAGISSLNESIACGVPMVVYPFDFLDQPGNAARVAYHRLGEVGDRHTETAATIGLRMERVLDDEVARRRIAQMRRSFEAYEDQDCAVRAVEALL